jgi:toxin-antitoxin system PIN domain toxin
VIAVDTNVLVYAHRAEMPRHVEARDRLVALAEGDAPWAIPVICLGEMVRVLTHPRLFDPPFTAEEACTAVERILESPTLRVLVPGARFLALFAAATRSANAIGNLAFDAQIAALCVEAGVSALLTEDRDFSRFEGLRTLRL